MARHRRIPRLRVLVIDVGGSHVKVLLQGESRARKAVTGPLFTPQDMVRTVRGLARGWHYDAISIGYPGPVWRGRPLAEPHNLGSGWLGFDYSRAFGSPVRLVNDAAMQAIGSYEGGRMLFLGLGTGLGTALIIDGMLEPTEFAHLPYKKGRTYEDYLGRRGLHRLGRKKWEHHVHDVVERLRTAFEVDYVVLGGGNARKLKHLPPDARLGSNAKAFEGGFRLWLESNWMPIRGSRARSPARPQRS